MEKKVILVSHGKLAEGVAYSAQMICGNRSDLSYYGMMPGEHYAGIVDDIRKQATDHPETQYIVLADFLGGSVCNGCMELVELDNIKLVGGMNLALVISLLFENAPVTDETLDARISESRELMKQVKAEELTRNDSREDFF